MNRKHASMTAEEVLGTLAEIRSLPETPADLTPAEADQFARDLERIRNLEEKSWS